MRSISKCLLALTLLISTTSMAAVPGTKAPDFKLMGHDGKEYTLASVLKQEDTKAVVLEWYNYGCPYVRKHYNTQNMQKLQKKYTAQNVKWFSIVSSKEGGQGYLTKETAVKKLEEQGSAPTAILLDPSSKTGRDYKAKVTPHMYVINKEGTVVYNGAIDDNSSSRESTVAGAKNHVVAALDSTLAGKKVELASTKAYGCSIKWADE